MSFPLVTRPTASGASGAATDQRVAKADSDNLVAIGEAARLAGVSVRALRYYGEVGLLEPAALSPGGHRLYGPPQLARVARIRELQDLMGFNLAEIAEVLRHEDRLDSIRQAFRRDEDPGRRRELVTEATAVLQELDEAVAAKQQRLAGFRRTIAQRMARAASLMPGSVAPEHRSDSR